MIAKIPIVIVIVLSVSPAAGGSRDASRHIGGAMLTVATGKNNLLCKT